MNFEKLRAEFKEKQFVKKEDVFNLINNFQTKLKDVASGNNCVVTVGKVYRPKQLKKYDLISAMVYSCPHPCIIFKTDENYVYAFGITSTLNNNVVCEIKDSRFFEGKYLTNTIVKVSTKEALNNFVGVFDNTQLAEAMFSVIKQEYNNIFN